MFSDVIDPKNWAYYNRKAVRAAKRAKKARLMKEIFGQDLVRSDYLAFDPFYDFGVSSHPISPVTRKTRKIASHNYQRVFVRKSIATNHSTPLYVAGPGINRRHPFQLTNYSSSETKLTRPSQPSIYKFLNDTSKKTRGTLSDKGELEMFRPSVYVPKSSYAYRYQEAETAGTDGYGNVYRTLDRTTRVSSGYTGRILQSTVDAYLNLERIEFTNLAEPVAVELLPHAIPSERKFNLTREIGELKDLPHLLKSSVDNVRNLTVNGTFNPFSQYLSQEFGWDPLVRAVIDAVSLPDKIAKRVNYLLSRLGKETTFRSKKKSSSQITGAPGFTFDTLIDETHLGPPTTSAFRITEWRLVTGYGVRFPQLELPMLKSFVTAQLWGARFRPDDFYNLVPWSWLIDWFGGLGDYIEAVSAVTDDTSVANYGLLTYDSLGIVSSNVQGKFVETRSTRFDLGPITTTNSLVYTNHTAVLKYKYLRRIDVTNISELKRTWVFEDLSLFQASILSALAFRR